MTNAGIVTSQLAALIAKQVEDHGLVVWYDPESNKLHLLHAIAYSGRVAHWEAEDFLGHLNEKRMEELEEFLEQGR